MSILWTYVSLLAMLLALGAVVYIIHAYGFWGGGPQNPEAAVAIASAPITSSQRKAVWIAVSWIGASLYLSPLLIGKEPRHQGWEFLELGRLWQILLFLGLVIWLFIVYRAVKSIFQKGKERGDLPHMYVYSAIAIVGFYAFTFLVSRDIHITMADYWRWWMVHIWVESIFEFFAVAIIALITVFSTLELCRSWSLRVHPYHPCSQLL